MSTREGRRRNLRASLIIGITLWQFSATRQTTRGSPVCSQRSFISLPSTRAAFSVVSSFYPAAFPSPIMSSYNRSIPSSSSAPNNRVRHLWPSFEKSTVKTRATMEHKVTAAKAKADADYWKKPPNQRVSPSQLDAIKAKLAKDIRQAYFEDVRSQWQSKLTAVGLRMEDWIDISEDEMDAVSKALGDYEDESDEEADVVPEPPKVTPPNPTNYSTTFLQPVAPSLSTSTRSTNISSASSYAFVNPSEFHSEDEDHFFMPIVVCNLNTMSKHVFILFP